MATGQIIYIRRVANDDTPPNRILELCDAAGINQRQLATLAHTDPSTINKLVKGTRGLDQDWMRRLAPLLGVTPAELLPRDENPYLLSKEERDLIDRLRGADAAERITFDRVATAVLPFRGETDDQAA